MKTTLPALLLLAFAPVAPAQAPPASTSPPPDIEFSASVHADRLTFASAPQAHVEFSGTPTIVERREVTREHLPDPATAGTFGDVDLRATFSVSIADPGARSDPHALPVKDPP